MVNASCNDGNVEIKLVDGEISTIMADLTCICAKTLMLIANDCAETEDDIKKTFEGLVEDMKTNLDIAVEKSAELGLND